MNIINNYTEKYTLQKLYAKLQFWDNIKSHYNEFDYNELVIVFKFLAEGFLNVKFYNPELIDGILLAYSKMLNNTDCPERTYLLKCNITPYSLTFTKDLFSFFEIRNFSNYNDFLTACNN